MWRLVFAFAVATAPPAPPAFTATAEAVRAAKLTWVHFVAEQFATPTAISAPCPSITAEQLAVHLQAVGLAPTAKPHGVTLYREGIGAGLVSIRCGVDLSQGSDPAGSTDATVDVTLLDGQADFPAYAQWLTSRGDIALEASPLGGLEVARCRSGPTHCVASWHFDGLVVTVRLELPASDENLARARDVLHAAVPEVVAALGDGGP